METEIKVDFPTVPTAPRERAKLMPLRPPANEHEQQQLANQLSALNECAAADQHVAIAPTHLVLKGEQVVGYGSLGGMPTMHVWMDTRHTNALDSVRMLEHAEVAWREKGVRHVLVPCSENSPFAPHMERLGFRRLGPTVLYVKEI